MVQENHQEKLKIIIFQYIMLTYFISLNMNDPVVDEPCLQSRALRTLQGPMSVLVYKPCQQSRALQTLHSSMSVLVYKPYQDDLPYTDVTFTGIL